MKTFKYRVLTRIKHGQNDDGEPTYVDVGAEVAMDEEQAQSLVGCGAIVKLDVATSVVADAAASLLAQDDSPTIYPSELDAIKHWREQNGEQRFVVAGIRDWEELAAYREVNLVGARFTATDADIDALLDVLAKERGRVVVNPNAESASDKPPVEPAEKAAPVAKKAGK